MGGRGGASGLSSNKGKLEASLDSRFKRYDYNGRIIYNMGGGNFVLFERKTDQIVRVKKTLKGAKEAADKWNEAVKKSRRK